MRCTWLCFLKAGCDKARVASALKLVLPITGGSCSKPANKKQKKEAQRRVQHCWRLVLKCYELRTRQHKMLNVNVLRPLKHYFLEGLMNFGRRL
jgi:hypothetical protein